jgi:hypothetical protein
MDECLSEDDRKASEVFNLPRVSNSSTPLGIVIEEIESAAKVFS